MMIEYLRLEILIAERNATKEKNILRNEAWKVRRGSHVSTIIRFWSDLFPDIQRQVHLMLFTKTKYLQRREKLQLIELKEFIKSFILELHR